MMDLDVLLWFIVLGIPILLLFSYETGILSFLLWVSRQLRPKPNARQPVQRTLAEWMDDTFPYLKRWVEEEYQEEEIQLMDAEDTEGN